MRILALAGSLRGGSLNRKLLDAAVGVVGDRAEIDRLDLRERPLPLYDGDLEERDGLPDGARLLKERIQAADALLIATPEYNHSIPGALKNVIDWASRPPGNPFRGRTALLMSASPGSYGGVRGMLALRQVLMALHVHVLPASVQVPRADQAFDAGGRLREERTRAALEKAVAELVRVGALIGRPD